MATFQVERRDQSPAAAIDIRGWTDRLDPDWTVTAEAGPEGISVHAAEKTEPVHIAEARDIYLFAPWASLAGVERRHMPRVIVRALEDALAAIGEYDRSTTLPQ